MIARNASLLRTALAVLALAAAPALAAPKAQKAPAPNDGGVPFQEIAPQQLAPGQCALFLWARTSPARRILMATQNPASVRIALKGKTVDLPLTAWDGEAHMGIHESQTFAADGVTVTVRFDGKSREGLIGGIVAESGSVELRDAEGWETVVPAAGMVACQPAA